MIARIFTAEALLSAGLLLAMPSAWGWVASAQQGYPTGIALAVTGCAVSLLLMIVAGRRED